MNLQPGVSIERGQVVTRQTIFDLVANALGGTVGATDLDDTVRDVLAQSLTPASVTPGLLWWSLTDQLMYCYVDAVENTACSLWCAFGPDRFDLPLLAADPIPFGAAVQLAGTGGRKVCLPPTPVELNTMGQGRREWENAKVIGFNNSGMQASALTAASGTWFAGAVDGIVWAWYPTDKDVGGGAWQATQGGVTLDGLLYGTAAQLTGPTSNTDVRGALGPAQVSDVQALADGFLCHSPDVFLARQQGAASREYWRRRVWVGARLCKHTAG